MPDPRVATLKKIDPKPGDIVHITVGLSAEEMGDGMPPWIPGPEEVELERVAWANVMPPGVYLHVTHIGVDVTLVKGDPKK